MAALVDNSERLIPCSFCEEKLPPSTIGNHLMTCGNKTDQCPNCRKYIRRAVFAYHYDNNCANLDEPDADVKAAVSQPAISSPTSSGSIPENNKDVSLIDFDPLPQPNSQSSTSQQSKSDFVEVKRETMLCQYCHHECEISERDVHQANCLQNPDNLHKRKRSQNHPTSGQNSDRLNYTDDLNNAVDIPCEYCNQPIKRIDLYQHTNTCAARYHQQIQGQSQYTNRMNPNNLVLCGYCHQDYTVRTVQQHEKNCNRNPDKIASENRFTGFLRRLAPPMHFGYPSWPY